MPLSVILAAAAALAAVQPASSAPAPFAGMQFLLGHCWQGTFADGKVDTHCFEPVYGGALIRDRHEVTGGYAGETIYHWNAAEGRAEYSYWNSSGGVSRGSMRLDGALLDFGDERYRGRDGREISIATRWRPAADGRSYDVLVTSSADPTGSRTIRYVRADRAPVRMEEVRGADGTFTLVHEVTVPAPPAEVYRALIDADGWRSWAVPHAWTVPGEAELIETAYLPAARQGDPRNIRQRFILRVPDRLVAFRTVQTPTGFPHADDYKRVTSLFELTPVGAGTRVRLSGVGYPATPAGETLASFFRDGNRASLDNLRTRFVTGPIVWPAPPTRSVESPH